MGCTYNSFLPEQLYGADTKDLYWFDSILYEQLHGVNTEDFKWFVLLTASYLNSCMELTLKNSYGLSL